MNESQAKLLERGLIVLPEEIDHAAYELLVEALDASPGRVLRLYCRGNGGDCWSALAMVDLIGAHGQVIGLLPGMAASSHGIVWAGCARRYVYPSARLGIHKVAWDSISTRSDSQSLGLLAQGYQQTEREGAAILAAASNRSAAEWCAAIQRAGSSGLITFDAAQLVALEMARPVAELGGAVAAVEQVMRRVR